VSGGGGQKEECWGRGITGGEKEFRLGYDALGCRRRVGTREQKCAQRRRNLARDGQLCLDAPCELVLEPNRCLRVHRQGRSPAQRHVVQVEHFAALLGLLGLLALLLALELDEADDDLIDDILRGCELRHVKVLAVSVFNVLRALLGMMGVAVCKTIRFACFAHTISRLRPNGRHDRVVSAHGAVWASDGL